MTQACLQLPIVEANRAGRFLADWRETRSAVALRPGACSGYLVITTPIAEGEKFDGLQASIAEQPVIVVAEQWPGDRQRFTLAHELGHLLLGGRLSAELNEEQACNRFAGAFLLPASTLRNQLGAKRHMLEIQELYLLKHEFGLSMAACLYRAKDLGIITPQTHKPTNPQAFKRGVFETGLAQAGAGQSLPAGTSFAVSTAGVPGAGRRHCRRVQGGRTAGNGSTSISPYTENGVDRRLARIIPQQKVQHQLFLSF